MESASSVPPLDSATDLLYYKGEGGRDLMYRRWQKAAFLFLRNKDITLIEFLHSMVKNIYGDDTNLFIGNIEECTCPIWKANCYQFLSRKGLYPPAFIRLVVDSVYGVNKNFRIKKAHHVASATEGQLKNIAQKAS